MKQIHDKNCFVITYFPFKLLPSFIRTWSIFYKMRHGAVNVSYIPYNCVELEKEAQKISKNVGQLKH